MKKTIQINICLENVCICEYIHTLIITTIVVECQINRPLPPLKLPNVSTFSNIFTRIYQSGPDPWHCTTLVATIFDQSRLIWRIRAFARAELNHPSVQFPIRCLRQSLFVVYFHSTLWHQRLIRWKRVIISANKSSRCWNWSIFSICSIFK